MKINDNMPKYIFTLISENGTIVCDKPPEELESMTINLNRDFEYGGVFVEFNIDSLTFIGSLEKRLLRGLWSDRRLLADCSLKISYLDMTTRTYIAFANNFKLDFNSYNEVLVSKSRNGVRLKTEVTGIVKKLRDRKGTKVDLTKLVSLGGYTIAEINHWASLKKDLNIPEIIVYNVASFLNSDATHVNTAANINFIVPFNEISSDYNETKTVTVAQNVTLGTGYALFATSERNRDIVLSDVLISVTFPTAVGVTADLNFYFAKLDTDGTTEIDTELIGTLSESSGQTKTLTFSKSFTLLADQSIIIYGVTDVIVGTLDFSFNANTANIQDEEISIAATQIETYPAYETIERCLQLILDTQYPLKSDFFGRTDVVKNSSGDYYASENQERFAQVMNGLSIRGLILSNTNNSFALSFDKIIKAYNALWNVGISHEIISGEDRIVFEDRASFYDDTIGLDLSDRIDDQEIQTEALPDVAYAKIMSGFNSFDYEVINGRGEYNTKNERTSPMTGSNLFDNVSDIRGDTRGITLALQTPIGTDDLKSDMDIFIIKSQRNGSEWDVEAEENIQVLNNTSIFGSNSMNLFFTPTRMMLRHNYELASGLDHETSSYLRFQTSDKLQDLETTDGADNIVENQDVQIVDLGNPTWNPSQFIVKLPFYEAEIVSLISNKHKRVKLSETKSGWILKANYTITKKEIELFIIEKYT